LRLADFYGSLAVLRDRETQLAAGAVVTCGVALTCVVLAGRQGVDVTPTRLAGLALALTVAAFLLRAGVACFPERRRAN
jgi:hypothetical protein